MLLGDGYRFHCADLCWSLCPSRYSGWHLGLSTETLTGWRSGTAAPQAGECWICESEADLKDFKQRLNGVTESHVVLNCQ